uniref:Uncharacterized protein n=1 Tax=Oryza brachyantha TaxID=4533 RepID=J3MXG4_ORYBR
MKHQHSPFSDLGNRSPEEGQEGYYFLFVFFVVVVFVAALALPRPRGEPMAINLAFVALWQRDGEEEETFGNFASCIHCIGDRESLWCQWKL